MPAHREPTELLELPGAFDKDPARRRPIGPKPDKPIGGQPACLASDEAACWREFVADAPAGVLTSGDRWALERLCCLMAKTRREGLSGAETGRLRGFLGEMGASPASRGRVRPAGPAEAPAAHPWDVAPPGRALRTVASAMGGGGAAHSGRDRQSRAPHRLAPPNAKCDASRHHTSRTSSLFVTIRWPPLQRERADKAEDAAAVVPGLRERLGRAERNRAEAERGRVEAARAELADWTAGGPLARAWRAMVYRRGRA